MASILLPPATAAAAALNTAIPIAQAGIAANAGYAGVMAPVLSVNLPAVTTNINVILTAITPAAPMGPPSLLTIPNCTKVLGDVVTITSLIAVATTESVAVLGGPSPSFPVSSANVAEQVAKLATFVIKNFVTPQI